MGMKSNYFRHSFDAHSDGKIIKLIKKCGAKGYAIYFTLLEVYCLRLMNDDNGHLEQEVDMKLIGSYLGLRSDSVHSCVIVMKELQLIEALSPKYDQTMVKLSIPKSLKYYGKYKNVSEENFPNKRKEKEIKLNESKEKGITPDEVLDLWNLKHGEKFGYCPGIGSGKHRENILEAIKFLKTAQDWENLFSKATSSEFLTGNNKSDWTVNFLWLIDYDNALKVLSDNFDDQKIVRAIQAEFLQKVQK